MRKMIILGLVLITASCATIAQLNSNMITANDIMAQNIQTMEISKAVIEENTRQIKRSTMAMRDFQYVFPIFFSILLLIFIYLLFKIYKMSADQFNHKN